MVNRPLRYGIVVSLAVLVGARGVSARQDRPESLILRRAASAVKKAEPGWRFLSAFPNVPPLVDEQLGVAAGGWYRSLDDLSMGINVMIYRISTVDAAAGWLYRQTHGGVTKEWIVTSYELGDGATMATYVGPLNPTQYSLWFRKGRFLAKVDGRSKDSVEHFAQILLTEMSD
jgi:hypothetical protein